MVGNDIVDLADPETRLEACHPRFDRRVFAPAEIKLLATTRSRVRMRWILWSAKEAAYKAARQACATTVFSPSRFVVCLDSALHGTVHHENRCWNVRIQLNGNCVHAVVDDEKFRGDAIWSARRLTVEERGDASTGARRLAVATVAAHLGLSVGQLRIERSGRIPQLVVEGAAPQLDLSLSHHGSYAGFVCRIGPRRSGLH
jgi:phosphopantetheinyl transferase (holo-ACP synthase)